MVSNTTSTELEDMLYSMSFILSQNPYVDSHRKGNVTFQLYQKGLLHSYIDTLSINTMI